MAAVSGKASYISLLWAVHSAMQKKRWKVINFFRQFSMLFPEIIPDVRYNKLGKVSKIILRFKAIRMPGKWSIPSMKADRLWLNLSKASSLSVRFQIFQQPEKFSRYILIFLFQWRESSKKTHTYSLNILRETEKLENKGNIIINKLHRNRILLKTDLIRSKKPIPW